jgi:small GTP-binding protein
MSGSPTHTFKLLILGDASVGKTTLSLRYVTEVFVESSRSTIGVDFFSKKIKLANNTKVKLQIWDFGGEERYRFLLPTYSQGTDLIMLLYDTNRRKSFDHIGEWIEVIRENVQNVPIILIGSKIDLVESREVSREEGEAKARALKVYQFMELSSKSGEYIQESLRDVSELLASLSESRPPQEGDDSAAESETPGSDATTE